MPAFAWFQFLSFTLARSAENSYDARFPREMSDMEGPVPSDRVKVDSPFPANGVDLAPPGYTFTAVKNKALALFEDGRLPRVTLVTASPGYGKTVLLAEVFRLRTASGLPTFGSELALPQSVGRPFSMLSSNTSVSMARAQPIFLTFAVFLSRAGELPKFCE
ncbi:hypothetical protein M9978_22285 [Sphingomonas sp. MG17]|uniref:Uncharacterized protein n=1 Tax=Sphingomonas tagetis TaxID=2949092 RepID=A0A9X2KNS8_9SPHN|nr:hypothetical protein [Sphingomonas tagetis]MCP3733137.1 hypothetical protein [Sphingomonas tagetis]